MTAATETRMPKQVRKAAKAAEEGIVALQKQREAEQTAPIDTTPAQPEGVTQAPPPEQPAPAAPPKNDELDQLKADLAKEKQRNVSLHGVCEVQKREARELKDRIQKLEEKATPATPDPERAKKHLTPEERETIGAATIDVTSRIARGEADVVDEKVVALEKRINEQGHRYFLSQLSSQHPEFDTINTEPDWLLWLGQEDRKTGAPRQELLDRAVASQSVARTWAFFEEFMRDTGYKPAEPPPSVQPRTTPPPKPAPVAASPTPTAEPKKRTFAQSYVKKFFKDVALGKYSGTKDEQKQIENDIALAERDGRIDYSR